MTYVSAQRLSYAKRIGEQTGTSALCIIIIFIVHVYPNVTVDECVRTCVRACASCGHVQAFVAERVRINNACFIVESIL